MPYTHSYEMLHNRTEKCMAFCLEKAKRWKEIEQKGSLHVARIFAARSELNVAVKPYIDGTLNYKWLSLINRAVTSCIRDEIERERRELCVLMQELRSLCDGISSEFSEVLELYRTGDFSNNHIATTSAESSLLSEKMMILHDFARLVLFDFCRKSCIVDRGINKSCYISEDLLNQWKSTCKNKVLVDVLLAIAQEHKDPKRKKMVDSGPIECPLCCGSPNKTDSGNVFHAQVARFNLKQQKSIVLPPNYKPLVLIHPVNAQKFGFIWGERLLVNSDCDEQVFHCIMSKDVSPETVVFPQRQRIQQTMMTKDSKDTVGQPVAVRHFRECSNGEHLATETCFELDVGEDLLSSTHIIDYLHETFDNVLLRTGIHLPICYMGFLYEVEVKWIKGYVDSDSVDQNQVICDLDSVSEQFADLKVDDIDASLNTFCRDSNHEKKYTVICSSPITTKQTTNDGFCAKSLLSVCEDNISYRTPHVYYRIMESTHIKIKIKDRSKRSPQKKIYFRNIGGVTKQLHVFKFLLHAFLSPGALSNDDNLPSGILLSGLSGTGKSLVCSAICNECHVSSITTRANTFKKYANAHASLKKVFQEAIERSPCILIVEDIDELFDENNSRVSQELLKLMDDLHQKHRKKVVLIGTTSKPKCIPSEFKRSGRLEREISLNIPTCEERTEILQKILVHRNHSLSDDEIKEIANIAHGYTGYDLESVCNKCSLDAELGCNDLRGPSFLEFQSLLQYVKNTKPSSMMDFVAKIPEVKWADVGGMEQVKEALEDMVKLPLKHPEQFKKLGISPVRGILLFGPPGCSKTMIAQAMATECHFNFISIKGPELFRQYVGESEKQISKLFQKARSLAPCVIFFDEIDSLASHRSSSSASNVESRILAQLLTEMDGIDEMQGVSVIAATNRPDLIDAALLRPGRFDRVLYVPLPNSNTRGEIFQIRIQKMPVADDINIADLVDATVGYSGAEIVAVCEEAAKQVIYRSVTSSDSLVKMLDFKSAIKAFPPRTTKEQVEFYEQYENMYHSH